MTDFYASTNDVARLRERVEELSRIRQGYAAHLGSSLYDATKDDASLRWGRESLYDGMAACDAERESILVRIAELEAVPAADSEPESEEPVVAPPIEEADTLMVVPQEEAEEAEEIIEEVLLEEVLDSVAEDGPEPEPEEEPVSFADSDPEPQTIPEAVPEEVVADEAQSPLTCPTCGAPVSENDRFCMTCGSSLNQPEQQAPAAQTTSISLDETIIQPLVSVPTPTPAPEPEPASVPEPESQLAQGPTCPSCGAAVAPGDKFCMECGKPLAPAPEPAPAANPDVCPSCGSPIDPSFKFCMTCGHKLA